MLDRAEALGLLPPEHRAEVFHELSEREKAAPSAIGHGVAVPHVYMESLERAAILFFRLREPVFMGALDGESTRYVFFLLGPTHEAGDHLNSLAAIARMMSDTEATYRKKKPTVFSVMPKRASR